MINRLIDSPYFSEDFLGSAPKSRIFPKFSVQFITGRKDIFDDILSSHRIDLYDGNEHLLRDSLESVNPVDIERTLSKSIIFYIISRLNNNDLKKLVRNYSFEYLINQKSLGGLLADINEISKNFIGNPDEIMDLMEYYILSKGSNKERMRTMNLDRIKKSRLLKIKEFIKIYKTDKKLDLLVKVYEEVR